MFFCAVFSVFLFTTSAPTAFAAEPAPAADARHTAPAGNLSRSFGGPAEYNTSKALEKDSSPGPKARDLSANSAAADASEKPEQDLASGIDGWIEQIAAKLNSDKPVTSADFDAVFNDDFFSESTAPFKDIKLLEKKVNDRLEGQKAQFGNSYRQWVADRLEVADLEPDIINGENTVALDFKTPQAQSDSVRIDINKARIKMAYAAKDEREVKRPDGSYMKTSFLKRHEKIIALPAGVNPEKYKVEQAPGRVRIIFNKLNGKKTETVK